MQFHALCTVLTLVTAVPDENRTVVEHTQTCIEQPTPKLVNFFRWQDQKSREAKRLKLIRDKRNSTIKGTG